MQTRIQTGNSTARDDPKLIVAVVTTSAVAINVLLTGPAIVGAYVDVLGVSLRDAGLLYSVDMWGLLAGALLMFVPSGHRCRSLAVVALLSMVAGNALSAQCASTDALALSRLLAGVGAGVVLTLTMRIIGEMQRPDVVFGLWTCGQLALGAAGLLVFPSILRNAGLAGVFGMLAVLSALLLPSLRYFPLRTGDSAAASPDRAASSPASGWLCLAGIFVYYTGQAAVWAYIERIGETWGLETSAVSMILLAGLVSGIAGAAFAVAFGNRVGRLRPIALSLSLAVVSAALLFGTGGSLRFALACCLFNLGWYLFLPYSSALIAAVDRNELLMTGLAVVFPASLAAGPALAAQIIDGEGLAGVLVVGLLSVPLGFAMIWPAARQSIAASGPDRD